MKFNDARDFDARVRDRNDAQLWQWSEGQDFAKSVTTRTRATGVSVTCVAHWKPAALGEYDAMAYVASPTRAAVALTTVSSPCRADWSKHGTGRSAR